MTDKSAVHIGENSPEEVAYKLFQTIASVEKKALFGADEGALKKDWTQADKQWILKTYGECITTIRQGWYEPN